MRNISKSLKRKLFWLGIEAISRDRRGDCHFVDKILAFSYCRGTYRWNFETTSNTSQKQYTVAQHNNTLLRFSNDVTCNCIQVLAGLRVITSHIATGTSVQGHRPTCIMFLKNPYIPIKQSVSHS